MDQKQPTQKPLWISHRGYCKNHAENTEGAFDAALALGFKRLETDLRLSKDGHLVLCHDPDLSRLGGPKRTVHSLTRNELHAISLEKNSKLMFFDEFMEKYAAYNWVFDIKKEAGAQTVAAFHSWVKRKNAADWVTTQAIFLLWDRNQQILLRDFLPRSVCFAREEECWRAGVAMLFGMPFLSGVAPGVIYSIPPKLGKIPLYRQSFISRYQARGSKVLAYLPETPEEALAAQAVGVDYILTNHEIIE